MVNRGLRALLLIAAAVVVVMGALTGYTAWRLRQGPIALDWVRPYIERRVDAVDPDRPVRIGGLALVWHAERRRVELRAIDVHVRLDDLGQELVLPAVAIYPRWRPLLRGAIELHHVALVNPRLALVRTEQGITLGGTSSAVPPDPTGGPALTTTVLLENLHELLAMLGFIELRDGEIAIDDRHLHHAWNASGVQGKLAVSDGRLIAHLQAQLHSNAQAVAAALTATEIADSGIELALQVDDVVPASLLAAIPATSPFKPAQAVEHALAAVTSPIAIAGSLALRAPGVLDGPITLKATSSPFSLEDSDQGIRLRDGKMALNAEIAPSIERVQIRDSTIGFGDAAVTLNGALTRTESGSSLEMHAALARFALTELRHYWPRTAAPAARHWVTENIPAGIIKQAAATIQMAYGAAPSTVRVDGKARFDDLRVRFAPNMPPATGLAGSVSVTGSDTEFTVERGRLDELDITDGKVRIVPSAGAAPAYVDVDVGVRGPLPRAIAVLAHEPVNLLRGAEFSPEDVDGHIEAKVHVTVPLGGPQEDTPTFAASARLDQVALRRPINGWPITAGGFDVRVGNSTVTVEGKAAAAGVPVSLNLRHELAGSTPSTVRLHAELDAPARLALGIDLGDAVGGAIPVSVHVTPRRDAPTELDINADLTAAALTPPLAAFGKRPGHPGRATAHLTLAPDRSLRIDRFDIDAGGMVAHGSAARAHDGWEVLQATVQVPQERQPAGGAATVELSAKRQADAVAFSLRSNNAGAVLNHLLTGKARGGTLRLDGTMHPSTADTTARGALDIQDLHYDSAPVIARLLTLGSLSGLKSTMLREGVHFDRIQATLDYQQGTVHIVDGRAEGDAMAILVSGSLDTNSRRMDLLTHLIPSYYGLNRAPQRIPVLGRLVEMATGEALQVIDARVHGPFDDPHVTVAPGSMVAPEVVKNQLRAWSDRMRGKSKAR